MLWSVCWLLGQASVRLCVGVGVLCGVACARAHTRFVGARWMNIPTRPRPVPASTGAGRWRPRRNALVWVPGSGRVCGSRPSCLRSGRREFVAAGLPSGPPASSPLPPPLQPRAPGSRSPRSPRSLSPPARLRGGPSAGPPGPRPGRPAQGSRSQPGAPRPRDPHARPLLAPALGRVQLPGAGQRRHRTLHPAPFLC